MFVVFSREEIIPVIEVLPEVNQNEAVNDLNNDIENQEQEPQANQPQAGEGEPQNDESEEEDNDPGPQIDDEVFGNYPLYENATVTVRESAAAIIAFTMNHNLSVSCLGDLLTLVQLHCPRNHLVKLSVHKLKKYHNFGHDAVNKIYYCSVCQEGLASPQDICRLCARRQPVSYFTQIPLIPQVRKLFHRRNFYNSLQERFAREQGEDGCLRDVYDGLLYKEHTDNGFLACSHHFSMTYYTDGVPVFKSKNYSFWGFFLTINELPYRERVKKENTLLAGLWCGTKPNANLFVYSFKEDLRTLYHGSRIWVHDLQAYRPVRGLVLLGVADLPAKANFLNCTAHNGFHGCLACEEPGETYVLGERKSCHVYRYQWPVQKRTVERMRAQGRQALAGRVRQANFHVNGVRGPTSLRLILPDFVRGSAIDFMHLIMGVVRKFTELLFDSAYYNDGFSLRQVIHVVDAMLQKIKPPRFVHRLPRSLEDICWWKASELKLWLFYYSIPILAGVMRRIYFQNYLKLVVALSYLCATSISEEMLVMADELIHSFLQEFQELYGLKHMTINFHNLLHVVDCVRNLGPAWGYSCFPYEDLNGQYLKVLHGTTDVDSQILRMHCQFLGFCKRLEQIPDGAVKDYCLQGKGQLKISLRLNDSCYLVGTYNQSEYDVIVTQALRNAGKEFETVRTFQRLLKDRLLYVAESYPRITKTDSSHVSFFKDNQLAYGLVYKFVTLLACWCPDQCQCPGTSYAIIKTIEKVEDFHVSMRRDMVLKHLFRCRVTLQVEVVPVEQLHTVCFSVNAHNKMYLGEPLNPYEVE